MVATKAETSHQRRDMIMDTIDVDAMSPQYRWSKLYAMAKELHMTCDHCGHCVERGFSDYCTYHKETVDDAGGPQGLVQCLVAEGIGERGNQDDKE